MFNPEDIKWEIYSDGRFSAVYGEYCLPEKMRAGRFCLTDKNSLESARARIIETLKEEFYKRLPDEADSPELMAYDLQDQEED